MAEWLLDIGVSSHMFPERNEFSNIDSLKDPRMITIADGTKVEEKGWDSARAA